MAEILTFTTEDEWKAARRKYVTSTEVAALFGQSPYLTAYELAVIKRDPSMDQFVESERTEWGKALQSAIGMRVASHYTVHVNSLDERLATLGFCAASGDYMIVGTMPKKWWAQHEGMSRRLADYVERLGSGILEIKNVDSLIFKNQWTETDMPDHIEIQLQAEMLCWDTLWGAVAALVGGNRLALYVRERDSKVCELILAESAKFMHNLARGILPDPIMPQDAEMVIRLHQYAEPNKVYDASTDTTVQELVRYYRLYKDSASSYEENAKTMKAKIFEIIGDAERVINCEGFNVSASMRADATIPAHIRKGYRDLRITERKSGKNTEG